MELNQDQRSLVNSLRLLSEDLADYVYDEFENGFSVDEVTTKLRDAVGIVDKWRSARGI